MAISDSFDGLSKGAKIIVVMLGVIIGAYALAILGLIVMGVLANVVTSGDVVVPTATNTSVSALLTSFNSLVIVVLNPFTTIAALIVIAVLLSIFFKGKMPGAGSSSVN